MNINSKIAKDLIDLGLLKSDENPEIFSEKTRDKSDILVLKASSGVIFLSTDEHVVKGYYEDLSSYEYWGEASRQYITSKTFQDDHRRATMIRPIVSGRTWLDVGTEMGGVLDILKGYAKEILAVEPQNVARQSLIDAGYSAYSDISEVRNGSIDVITAFHVLEHVPDNLGFLSQMRQKLKPGGRICIEVPHARDALLVKFDCKAFRESTLWSEHLILHTRESLSAFIGKAGFVDVQITGVQRYNIANHMHWLSKGLPGGHNEWNYLSNPIMDELYEKQLSSLDMTDTLVAWARAR
ncbi:class I SAM-dependent methyltransferase (plasmid) [Azospirillum sp. TSA2s]|uniref:class I SAM-dependent methyltransferase n=1 Tax=Azospirillum sp. TSA2s TaxID=709810 RepID=UPI0010AA2EB8|nr:class I SAM-dependent methyltransferase [Azospirillum sp. TSA2s]QCG93040.1 class I SAM-dependent methyltransferase [Azospirillum sp. TSA2s]